MSTFSTTENNEMEKEKFNNLPQTSKQLQHLQEIFAAELAEKQINENQQHQGLSSQSINCPNNRHINPDSFTLSQIES